MNNDEFVTLEQAKHLHRLGFSELCFGAYTMNHDGNYDLLVSAIPTMNCPDVAERMAAPSQAMTMRWLRDYRNVYTFIKTATNKDGKIEFNVSVCRRKVVKASNTERDIEVMIGLMQIDGFATMGDAYSAAIDEILAILKPKKQ